MIKKIIFLLFLFCIFTILVNVKVNGETIIELPKEYVQVGIGRDDLIIEDNLTVTSGYVNWDLEGNYIITYIDRLDNIYKKEFVIIESVDNQYLLNEGKIKGAAIDVFDYEPPLNNDYPLLHSKNTLLTPHTAFLTKEALENIADVTLGNIDSFFNKNEIINQVK